MSFEFNKTEIEGLIVITPHSFVDCRGSYVKKYEKLVFCENGIEAIFTESSEIISNKGALRGLHYQREYSQAKLIHVISGKIFDVALDLRENSSTFGRYHCELLHENDNKTIYIPEGFAHGFIALEDNTIFSYQCSGKYHPSSCGGIRWDDPDLKISWPLKEYGISKVIATEKDMTWPTFREYREKLL